MTDNTHLRFSPELISVLPTKFSVRLRPFVIRTLKYRALYKLNICITQQKEYFETTE